MTDSPDQTLALARTTAGAARSLNHATLGGEGLAQPADAYELIGELALAACDARAGADALARDLGCAQQQLAAVHGGPSAAAAAAAEEEEEEGEGEF